MPEDANVVVTGGWDRIMKIYDTRVGKPVAQILGPMVCGDSIDIHGDQIIAGSNRHKEPLATYSISMQKVMTEISFDPPNTSFPESGYCLAARLSKDKDHSLIFAGGAGRNELRVFDNDTDGSGRYRELANLNNNQGVIMCIDTAPNGRAVAWGNHLGHIFVSSFDLNESEEPDLRTIAGRVSNKRNQEARQSTPA